MASCRDLRPVASRVDIHLRGIVRGLHGRGPHVLIYGSPLYGVPFRIPWFIGKGLRILPPKIPTGIVGNKMETTVLYRGSKGIYDFWGGFPKLGIPFGGSL